MATVASTNVKAIPPGYNNDNRETFQADVASGTASADVVTITLPSRWQGKGFGVVSLLIEQFNTADAGARSKSSVAITSYSFVETTGVISVVLGANVTGTAGAKVLVTVMPST